MTPPRRFTEVAAAVAAGLFLLAWAALHTAWYDEGEIVDIPVYASYANAIENGAVEAPLRLGGEDRVLAPQGSEVAMQRHGPGVAFELAPVETAGREGGRLVGNRHGAHGRRIREARELLQEIHPARAHEPSKVRLVISEVEEGRGGPELLALEQHRGAGHEQHQRGHRACSAGACELMEAQAAGGVGDLIMVLDKDDEGGGGAIEPRRPAPCVRVCRMACNGNEGAAQLDTAQQAGVGLDSLC